MHLLMIDFKRKEAAQGHLCKFTFTMIYHTDCTPAGEKRWLLLVVSPFLLRTGISIARRSGSVNT
jgi:hypothetical protein